jgi:peptidoglycan/xylan/chitin deacetylase (PgdA/CDA1 family)
MSAGTGGGTPQPRPVPAVSTHGTTPRSSPDATTTPTATSGTVTSAAPASTPARWLLGQDWERIPTTRQVVALTFDAGGDAAGVLPILDVLASQNVRATFFLTGAWTREHPVKARTIAATHRVGNHSMTHPHFPLLTDAQINRQLRRPAEIISSVCDVDPAPLFRFPYGDRDAHTIAAVNAAGYVPVRWTVDTLGWKGTRSGISVDSIVKRIIADLQPGEIVMMHVGSNPYDHSTLDADALPGVIKALRDRGYGFVTLNALLTARK